MRISRPFLLIVFSCVLSAHLSAQPKLTVVGSSPYDFGNIYRGQVVTHDFELKNTGADTLVIKNVGSSCGCTAVLLASSRVPPDSSTKIKVAFSSGGYLGQVQKSVIVSSNDSTNPTMWIFIKANVTAVLESDPSTLHFAIAKVDSTSNTSVRLKNVTGKTVKILSVEPGLGGLTAEIDKTSLKPGETAELMGKLKPIREGMNFADVAVKTDFQPQPDVLIHVTANVRK